MIQNSRYKRALSSLVKAEGRFEVAQSVFQSVCPHPHIFHKDREARFCTEDLLASRICEDCGLEEVADRYGDFTVLVNQRGRSIEILRSFDEFFAKRHH